MATSSQPDAAEVEAALVEFIAGDLGWEGDRATLTGAGCQRLPEVLDSQDLLEIAGFIESSYDLQIDDTEINADNFGTLPEVVAFVCVKIAHDAS